MKKQLFPVLVKSAECKADSLSRLPLDKGDYTMDMATFRHVLFLFQDWIEPDWDIFASPGNHKFQKFICRWPHWEASLVDALNCDLTQIQECYSNPPWTCMGKWPHPLRENPHMKCLMITPFWVSAQWWPLLLKLRVPKSPVVRVNPFQGLFTSSGGQEMPPTRGALVCTLLSWQHWRGNKSALKISNVI